MPDPIISAEKPLDKPMADLVVSRPVNADQARDVCTEIRKQKSHQFFVDMKKQTDNTWKTTIYALKSGGGIIGPVTVSEAAFKAIVIAMVNQLPDVKFG